MAQSTLRVGGLTVVPRKELILIAAASLGVELALLGWYLGFHKGEGHWPILYTQIPLMMVNSLFFNSPSDIESYRTLPLLLGIGAQVIVFFPLLLVLRLLWLTRHGDILPPKDGPGRQDAA